MGGSGRRNRKRDRDELDSLIKNESNEEDEEEVVNSKHLIQFQNGEVSLKLKEGSHYYTKGKCNYDEELIESRYHWHKIIICHKQRFAWEDVLPELFKVVGDEYFAPIGYRNSRDNDFFFVIDQEKALKKLFDTGLRIHVKSSDVDLSINLGVETFKPGMLDVPLKLSTIINTCINNNALNLSNISSHQQLVDVKFTLSNIGCLLMLCKQLNSASKLHQVKILNLSNNNISHIWPLSSLKGFNVSTIDLQYNKIDSIDKFHCLRDLNPQALLLLGNPIADTSMLVKKLREILPTLRYVDIERSLSSRSFEERRVDNRSEPIKNVNLNPAVLRSVDVDDYVKKQFKKYERLKSWNKVIVEHNGKVSKNIIIEQLRKKFLNMVQFYPCYYQSGVKSDSFFLCQNFMALECLIHNGLKLRIHDVEVKFELHMDIADWVDGQVHWAHKINYVINKRTMHTKLILDELKDDSDLTDVDVSLSTICGFMTILNSAKALNNKTIMMSLQNNKISNTEGFKVFNEFPNLVSIDLTNNDIKTLEGWPRVDGIVEVHLDQNPLCEKYYDKPWKYIRDLLRVFPRLDYVDGRRIDKKAQIVSLQNFFISQSAYTLTESFIKFFFDLYDSAHRDMLKELYGTRSLISIRIDFNTTVVHRGQEAIIGFFMRQPLSQHDFATLCIDVPIMTKTKVMIIINGYFKQKAEYLNEPDTIVGFTRTFLLERDTRKSGTMSNTFTYYIENELVEVRSLDVIQQKKAFVKSVVSDDDIKKICWDQLPQESEEKEASALLLKEITNLKKKWCERILQDSNWDIKFALTNAKSLFDRQIFTEDDFDKL